MPGPTLIERLRRELGRIRVRLLVVNLVVLLVPVAGLEFARLYERQLLGSLERDMANQAVLVAAMLASGLDRGLELDAPEHGDVLTQAARHTRTRVRILDGAGAVVVDSHANGPPEGPEPPRPVLIPSRGVRGHGGVDGRRWLTDANTRWHWRYRAAYTRWLHNEYTRAGYPVRHHQFRTYVRVVPCCCCRDYWRR